MYKKIEIWILYLIIVLLFLFTIFFSSLTKYYLEGGKKLFFLEPVVIFISSIPTNFIKILKNESQLASQLYSDQSFYKQYKSFTNKKKELVLISRYDGEIERSIIEIRDINDFKLLYRYSPDIKKLIDKTDFSKKEFSAIKDNLTIKRYHFWHPIINKNGEFIFHSGSPLIKTNFCGDILWINNVDRFHHSINIQGNFIWVPSRIFPNSLDYKIVGKNPKDFNDDAITKVSNDGKIIYQKSVAKILLENDMQNLLFSSENFNKNPIHLNDIEPVNKDGKYWKKGDLFLSLRNLSMIILYRPSTNKIINIIKGDFLNQHDVDIIDEETISIFNNNAVSTINGMVVNEESKVILYNFGNKKFYNKHYKNSNNIKFSTTTHGLSEILEDGSMLVEDRNNGRIVMFNGKEELVWSFVNKYDDKIYNLWWSRIIKDKNIIEKIYDKIKSSKC